MKLKKLNGVWYLNNTPFTTLHDALTAAFNKR